MHAIAIRFHKFGDVANHGLVSRIATLFCESLKSFFVSNAQAAKIYYQLWRSKKANRLPLIVLTSFRLLVVAFFIVTVVHQFLTENQKVTLILLVASVALISRSKWLLSQYLKMEAQFLDNLKGSAPEKDDDPSE